MTGCGFDVNNIAEGAAIGIELCGKFFDGKINEFVVGSVDAAKDGIGNSEAYALGLLPQAGTGGEVNFFPIIASTLLRSYSSVTSSGLEIRPIPRKPLFSRNEG